MQFITTLATLIAAASAITVTFPPQQTSNPPQYNNGSLTVTWSSVNTDPNSLNVLLSTNNGQSTRVIASDVRTSLNSYTVDLTGLTPGNNYAINLAPSTSSGQSGILAQSGTFQVLQGTVASSSSSSSAAATSSSSSSATTGATGATSTSATSSATGTAATAIGGSTATGSAVRASGSAASGVSALASGSGVSGAASAGASGSAGSGGAATTSSRNSGSQLQVSMVGATLIALAMFL